jgi:hypothetical protein
MWMVLSIIYIYFWIFIVREILLNLVEFELKNTENHLKILLCVVIMYLLLLDKGRKQETNKLRMGY